VGPAADKGLRFLISRMHVVGRAALTASSASPKAASVPGQQATSTAYDQARSEDIKI
jgi:hypothetical protein